MLQHLCDPIAAPSQPFLTSFAVFLSDPVVARFAAFRFWFLGIATLWFPMWCLQCRGFVCDTFCPGDDSREGLNRSPLCLGQFCWKIGLRSPWLPVWHPVARGPLPVRRGCPFGGPWPVARCPFAGVARLINRGFWPVVRSPLSLIHI